MLTVLSSCLFSSFLLLACFLDAFTGFDLVDMGTFLPSDVPTGPTPHDTDFERLLKHDQRFYLRECLLLLELARPRFARLDWL
jgi:hypothetical protein